MQPTNNIQPICLATGVDNYKGQEVTVAGWGTLKEGGSQPATLQKVDVHVWANSRCKSSYGSSAPGGITNHMLCASDYQRDSCSVSVHTSMGPYRAKSPITGRQQSWWFGLVLKFPINKFLGMFCLKKQVTFMAFP